MTTIAFYIYILFQDTILRSNTKFFSFNKMFLICPVLADIFYFKTYFKIQRVISHLSQEEQLEEWKHSMLLSDYIGSDCYNIISPSIGNCLSKVFWKFLEIIIHIPESYYIGAVMVIVDCVYFYGAHRSFVKQFENLIGPLTLPQSLYFKHWYVLTQDVANHVAARVLTSITEFYRVIGVDGWNMQRPVDFYVKFMEETITADIYSPTMSLIFSSV